MQLNWKVSWPALALVVIAIPVAGQERIPPRPIRHPANFSAAVTSGTRDPGGAPGPAYWQQQADYTIAAALDVETGRITGRETITYHNNSPDVLSHLVMHVEQNVFRAGSRRNRRAPITGGVEVGTVTVNGVEVEAVHPGNGYYQAFTLLDLRLPEPLAAGATAVIELTWEHTIPPAPTFRSANLDNEVFNVAQWYPRMAVYDDVYGWDASPYLGDGEFYLEYGDFDVSLTVPAGWLVGATGTLMNPAEVLSPTAASRLEAAYTSAETVHIVTAEERGAGTATAGSEGDNLVWHFTAENVRDFAWATSDNYVWDAASVDGRALAQALYRPRFEAWPEGVRYVAHTIRSMSQFLGDYAYPQLTIVEGPVGGMEYPMMVFNPPSNRARGLAGVTIHEGAHQWFPMMVGSMEAKHAWMDEGFVSYWDALSSAQLWDEEPPRWGENGYYLSFAGTEAEVPLMRHTDLVSPYGARGLAAYTKPAVMLGTLRSVLGDEVFLAAFRTYFEEWQFKHPQPWDFFNTFERVAGQDLDWFWRPLAFETDVLDHEVAGVVVSGGRTTVTIRDNGDVILPAVVMVRGRDTTISETVPASYWLAGHRSYEFTVTIAADAVMIDPEAAFPDVDRSNNSWGN